MQLLLYYFVISLLCTLVLISLKFFFSLFFLIFFILLMIWGKKVQWILTHIHFCRLINVEFYLYYKVWITTLMESSNWSISEAFFSSVLRELCSNWSFHYSKKIRSRWGLCLWNILGIHQVGTNIWFCEHFFLTINCHLNFSNDILEFARQYY